MSLRKQNRTDKDVPFPFSLGSGIGNAWAGVGEPPAIRGAGDATGPFQVMQYLHQTLIADAEHGAELVLAS